MDAWVWLLIGFAVGLVVSAIFRLIFRKNPTAELEQAADEKGAQLSKAEMKAAVLQEKLHDAEFSLEAQRDADQADCQQKLAAAEAQYREQLDLMEKQFADLEVSFAAQLAAKEEEKVAGTGVAAGLAAGMALASEQSLDDEANVEIASWDVGAADQIDPRLETAASFDEEKALEEMELAQPDAVLIAGAALVEDEAGDEEIAPAVEDEVEVETAVVEDEAAIAAGMDDESDVEAAVAEDEEKDNGIGAFAKAALAAAGAAVAAVVLGDEEDNEEDEEDDEEEVDEIESGEEEDLEEAEIEEELQIDAAEDEVFVASAALVADAEEPIVEEAAPEETVEPMDALEEEESHLGLAAAAVGAGAAAAVLAAADDDGEEEIDPPDEEVETEADADAVEDEPETAVLDLEEESDDVSDLMLDIDDPLLATAAAAGIVAAVGDDDDAADELQEMAAPESEEAVEEEEQPQEPVWPEDTSTWQGEFFNNMNLEGEPELVREDAEVDFDWGMESPAPGINADRFSVRWTRTAELPPGLYRFTVTSDDGARLFVNERMIISAWYDHTEMTFRREIELPGGPVDLRLEYYENAMAALIRVSWERIG